MNTSLIVPLTPMYSSDVICMFQQLPEGAQYLVFRYMRSDLFIRKTDGVTFGMEMLWHTDNDAWRCCGLIVLKGTLKSTNRIQRSPDVSGHRGGCFRLLSDKCFLIN